MFAHSHAEVRTLVERGATTVAIIAPARPSPSRHARGASPERLWCSLDTRVPDLEPMPLATTQKLPLPLRVVARWEPGRIWGRLGHYGDLIG